MLSELSNFKEIENDSEEFVITMNTLPSDKQISLPFVQAEDVRTHSGGKSHKCDHCEYVFTKASQLKIHFRNHSGEKPFRCSFCDYTSVQTSNLRAHLKNHSAEKPFKCKVCNFASSQAGHLRAHSKTHSGDKSHKCNVVLHLPMQTI